MARIVMLTQQRVMKPECIHPVVIEDDAGELLLVDCGDPELGCSLMESMKESCLDPKRISKIIITHHDLDHMGGLREFCDELPDAIVMASEFQADYIKGEKRWLRLQKEDRDYLSVQPSKRIPSSRVRAQQYFYFLPGRVDQTLKDGDELNFAGGIKAIFTPWHMPGHLSLYFEKKKALICGDALNTFDQKIDLNRHVDLCPEETVEGLKKLCDLEVETVYCYHGGLLKISSKEFACRIKELIREYSVVKGEK